MIEKLQDSLRKWKNYLHPLILLYAAMILTGLVYILFFTDMRQVFRGYPAEHAVDFTTGWRNPYGREESLKKLPASDEEGVIRLYNTIPEEILWGESLNLTSHNVRFSIFIGDAEVYRYYPGENLTGSGTGDIYHHIALSPDDAGKTVCIEVRLPYAGESGGRFPDAVITGGKTFYYLVFHENGLGFLLSSMIVLFGVAIAIIHFGMYGLGEAEYDLLALAAATMLIGGWTLIESNIPQILIGSTEALRIMDYYMLPLAEYPLVCFVQSIAKRRRKWYSRAAFAAMAVTVVSATVLRLSSGVDMHNLMPLYYASYLVALVLILLILRDNHRYCKERNLPEDLRYFRIGAIAFIAGGVIDILRYTLSGHAKSGNGGFLRFGLFVFIAATFIQVIEWITRERRIGRRDRFINSLLRYAMSGDSAETTIRQMLEYLGKELRAEKTYIYEDMGNGVFENTYEWCAPDLPENVHNVRTVPYDGVVNVFYEEYDKAGYMIVEDLEECKEVLPAIYNLLIPRGIRSMVTAPLILDEDKYAGFFGIDNAEPEMLEDISEILQLLQYFLSEVIGQRATHRKLIQYSYYDQMTGTKNRRALYEFEQESLDPAKPYGYVMCDINGLKKANDTEGHEAGDRMIKDVADVLVEVFAKENVYRMGGDEFAAYDTVSGEQEFRGRMERVRELLGERGRSASLGFVFRPDGDADYEAVKKEADEMMYADKERYYQGRNDRRTR